MFSKTEKNVFTLQIYKTPKEKMKEVSSAIFVKSSPKLGLCPPERYPEFAFIGRSNVGKSSLINMMVNQKDLAKTSSTPGKTQLINHFLVNNHWYLVDLPGYGWARTGKEMRKGFEELITEFLIGRTTIVCTFVLVDLRLDPQPIDLEFMEWMAEQSLPFTMVFTKADKLSRSKIDQNLQRYFTRMRQEWEEIPPYLITSAENRTGKADLLAYIEQLSKEFTASKK